MEYGLDANQNCDGNQIKARPARSERERERERVSQTEADKDLSKGSRADEKVLRSCCGSAASEGFLPRERERELNALFTPTLFIMVKFLPARMMRWTRETRKKSSAIIRRRS